MALLLRFQKGMFHRDFAEMDTLHLRQACPYFRSGVAGSRPVNENPLFGVKDMKNRADVSSEKASKADVFRSQ